jgi:hypothetical protein
MADASFAVRLVPNANEDQHLVKSVPDDSE